MGHKGHQRKGARRPKWLPYSYDPRDFEKFVADFTANMTLTPPPQNVSVFAKMRTCLRKLMRYVASFF